MATPSDVPAHVLRTRARPNMVLAASQSADGVSDESFLTEEASPSPSRTHDWTAVLASLRGKVGQDEIRALLEAELKREAVDHLADLSARLDAEEWLFDYPKHKR